MTVQKRKMDKIAQDLDQKGVKKMYFSKIDRSMKLGGKAQIGHDTQNNNHNQQPGRIIIPGAVRFNRKIFLAFKIQLI